MMRECWRCLSAWSDTQRRDRNSSPGNGSSDSVRWSRFINIGCQRGAKSLCEGTSHPLLTSPGISLEVVVEFPVPRFDANKAFCSSPRIFVYLLTADVADCAAIERFG